MSTDLFSSVLERIHRELEHTSIDWALTGSLSFKMRGLDIPVHDIDIQTDKQGAFEIEERFKKFVSDSVQLRSSPNIRSYFGKMNIDGVSIEIIGVIEKLTSDGQWVRTPKLSTIIELVPFGGMIIPVLNLEYEYEAYRLMGRLDKANVIHRLIEKAEKR